MSGVLRSVTLLLAMMGVGAVYAQAVQVVEDKDVAVRISIPKSWERRDRDREIFINCAPAKEDRGRPACYFTVRGWKVPAEQKTITEADRVTWKGWVHANGMRPIVSTRDIKVAGMPAYEILHRQGNERNEPLSRRVFILVPGKGQVLDASLVTMLDPLDYDRYSPAVAAALETLVSTK
jgi:hypothetical protein